MIIVHAIWGMPRTSGVSTFCAEIAAEQVRLGHRVIILNDHDDRCPVDPSVERITGSSMDVLNVRPDIVHVHAFWSMFALRVMRWCRRYHVPYVVSPHGGLMPRVFTVGRVKKMLFWLVALRPILSRARCIHCTGESEVEACRNLRLRPPCFIAPLGVHMSVANVLKRRGGERLTVLYLGRLSEEKGLVILLDAWKQIMHLHAQSLLAPSASIQLVLAGPDWRGYKATLEDKIISENIGGVMFSGPADEDMKHRLYCEAEVFVLPSPMENFSMVVLEALSYGVPTIATIGTPWRILEDEHCGWWIEPSATAIKDALVHALSISCDERLAMGERAKSIVSSRYQWSHVAEKVLTAYFG